MTTPCQHALVVGGTRGIGRAVVRRLLRDGRKVSVLARTIPPEPAASGDLHYATADLTDTEKLLPRLKEIVVARGKIQSLVFVQRYRGEGDAWEGEWETSVTATRQVIDALRGDFAGDQDNAIVIVNSNASEIVVDEQPLSYHVAKAALLQLVRYYALNLGPLSIRVNGVCPITTLKPESQDYYLKNESLMNRYKKMIPLGRLGTADEVANVVAFLCSRDSSFITGQNLTIDGGISLRGHEALARILSA